MFWQAAVLVATVRKPLFGKLIQMDMEHFLPHLQLPVPGRRSFRTVKIADENKKYITFT